VLERKRARFFFTHKCDETDYPIFSAFFFGHKTRKKTEKKHEKKKKRQKKKKSDKTLNSKKYLLSQKLARASLKKKEDHRIRIYTHTRNKKSAHT